MRFRVTELNGFTIGKTGRTNYKQPVGLSCHVVDTHWLCAVVGSWRSEDVTQNNQGRIGGHLGRDGARAKAWELADRLNAEHEAAKVA